MGSKSLQEQLRGLEKGDVLVCRDGTRRTFAAVMWEEIQSSQTTPPTLWSETGRWVYNPHPTPYDIVRVIKKRKVRVDKDVAWLRKFAYNDLEYFSQDATKRRLRKIATRLEKGTT